MNLTVEDVEEIIRILDASTYADLRLETGRFTLVLRRQGSGWTQESEVRSVPTSVPGTDPLTPERAPLASAVPAPPAVPKTGRFSKKTFPMSKGLIWLMFHALQVRQGPMEN
jgi:hypothetical protein